MSEPDSAMERRTVLLAGGAAATAVLSGCIVQRADPPAAPTASTPVSQGTTGAPEQQPALAKVADIPAGGGVILADQKVVLTKDQSGKVAAFSAVCTHQGCVVGEVSNGTINCPCHGSKFDVASGQPVGGPAPKPLPPVAIQQRDGAIYQA